MGPIVEPHHFWKRHSVEELGLLVDGSDYYRELYRACANAKKSILLTGWQFDSDVELVRGPAADGVETPTALLPFLNHLCQTRPDLKVCILAWDFNVVFAAEREWMQELIFHWTTHERLAFRFDKHHVELASHHQKFVVVDDDLVFTGGLDVCDHRWDDSKHCSSNPLRFSRGEPHQPFHDIQVWMRSREMASTLKGLFARRWELAGGDPLELDGPCVATCFRAERGLPIPARQAALSRIDPYGLPEGQLHRAEILELYLAAISRAERLIYVETQYMSSKAITDALVARMRDAAKPRLELVFMLNMRGETLKEQAAVGLAQAQNLGRLREAAAETGHHLGLYFTWPHCDSDEDHPERGTYIHSKLMIVDDTFLTVGSANLTNRSMGVDTELNVTVEGPELEEAIRAIRVSLLKEHSGGKELPHVAGLVAAIDADSGRLKHHTSPTEGEKKALEIIDPDKLPFDPEQVEELDVGLVTALTRAARELLSAGRTNATEAAIEEEQASP
ncbi:MAG: phospholipase [Archangiaceae bacterium]|nr:phospholipase [Archangiaceae bacterium]